MTGKNTEFTKAVRKSGIASIHALPARAGDIYALSHQLQRWSSTHLASSTQSIALSFGSTEPEDASVFLARGQAGMMSPDWDERLVLCAFYVVRNHHSADAERLKHILGGILTVHGSLLSPAAHSDRLYSQNFEALFIA